jgi:hypothetical protein
MFGLFKKFKDGFAKTVSAIATRTRGLFGGRKIDAASLDELEEALYTADFGVETTNEILAEIKKAYGQDKELQGQHAAKIGAEVLKRVLAGAEGTLDTDTPGAPAGAAKLPIVIAMIGVNGSGKTTTSAKLGWKLKQEGKTVTLAACDTFRAAAVEQLKSWATRLDLEIIASHTGADSASVALDCGYSRPAAHEEQPHGGAGEDSSRAAEERSDCAAAPLARCRWLAWQQLNRASPRVSPKFWAHWSRGHEAGRHEPRRRARRYLSAVEDPDLLPWAG